MANKSKAKGTRFEKECMEKLCDPRVGFKDPIRAWGSDGRSLGLQQDVDLVVSDEDNAKYNVQCKVRKAIPKWLRLGNNDMLLFKEDRGEIFVITRLIDKRNKK